VFVCALLVCDQTLGQDARRPVTHWTSSPPHLSLSLLICQARVSRFFMHVASLCMPGHGFSECSYIGHDWLCLCLRCACTATTSCAWGFIAT
jgi:hypothetical protein